MSIAYSNRASWQPFAAGVFVFALAALLALPALTSSPPNAPVQKTEGFALPTEAERGRPIPTAPLHRPITAELDCNKGGGAIFLTDWSICMYSNTWPNSGSWSGVVLSNRNHRPLLRPLSGALVTIHVETLSTPVSTVTDRWGQFAFVNLPMRRHGVTCGSQSVQVRHHGSFLEGRLVLYDGRWGQTLELDPRQDQISSSTYHMPKRCLRYTSPLTLK